MKYLLILALISPPVWADACIERSSGNDLNGTVTLQCKPCEADATMQQAMATRIVDGEHQTVYACWTETMPPEEVVQSTASHTNVQIFGIIHIIDGNVTHQIPSTEFK